MNFLIFDTVTTEMLSEYNDEVQDYMGFPRIIELSFLLINEDGDVIKEYSNLIIPDGWEIPNEKSWIDNGYSNKNSINNGVEILDVLIQFINALAKADYIVAHNLDFVYSVLISEIIGYKRYLNNTFTYEMLISFEHRSICTMKQSVEYCKIPKINMINYKYPKLQELYFKLFEKKYDTKHSLLEEVHIIKECFFRLKELKVINILDTDLC
jgi:hypothetical protein